MGVSFNQKYDIAKLVRAMGSASRLCLSKEVGIALPTVSTLVRDLMKRGLICEHGFGESAGGRKPARLKLSPDYAGAIGVELTTRRISSSVVDLVGNIRANQVRPMPDDDSVSSILENLFALIGGLINQIGELPLRGIGIGISGLVDRAGRVSRELPEAEGWKDVKLAEIIEQRFGLPTTLLNAVHSATLGEWRFGQWRDGRNMVYLHMGRGISLGLIADGKLYQGATGNAGEFGHNVIREGGPICYCGNRGCLEGLASPKAIVEQCKEAVAKGVRSQLAQCDPEALSLDDVLAAAEAGDRLGANAVEEAGRDIGGALSNLVNVYNPDVLMFGGLLARGPNALTRSIERSFRARVLPLLRDETRVAVSRLGDEACGLGAAAMIFERMFDSPEALLGPPERKGRQGQARKEMV